MTDGVYALMHPLQPAISEPSGDTRPIHTCLEQLCPGDTPVLQPRRVRRLGE
jgi:hypothetical protein